VTGQTRRRRSGSQRPCCARSAWGSERARNGDLQEAVNDVPDTLEARAAHGPPVHVQPPGLAVDVEEHDVTPDIEH
jgi:hypothetical protein